MNEQMGREREPPGGKEHPDEQQQGAVPLRGLQGQEVATVWWGQ